MSPYSATDHEHFRLRATDAQFSVNPCGRGSNDENPQTPVKHRQSGEETAPQPKKVWYDTPTKRTVQRMIPSSSSPAVSVSF